MISALSVSISCFFSATRCSRTFNSASARIISLTLLTRTSSQVPPPVKGAGVVVVSSSHERHSAEAHLWQVAAWILQSVAVPPSAVPVSGGVAPLRNQIHLTFTLDLRLAFGACSLSSCLGSKYASVGSFTSSIHLCTPASWTAK